MPTSIDVIIPHRNRSKYLNELLSSVKNMTDLHISVIVVDDASHPNELEKITNLKKKYDFDLIPLRSEKPNGAGFARNIALDHCKSEYVLFADSDDFFYDNVWQIISGIIKEYPDKDLYHFTTDSVEEDGSKGKRLTYTNCYLKFIKHNYDNLSREQRQAILTLIVTPVSKLIKRKLLEAYKIRFDEIRVSEDVMFSTKIGVYAESVVICDSPVYVCREHKERIGRDKSFRTEFGRFNVLLQRNDFLFEAGLGRYRKILSSNLIYFIKKYGVIKSLPILTTVFRSKHPLFHPIRYYFWAFNKFITLKEVHEFDYYFRDI